MKEQKTYISLARVICAISVVMIHTNTCFKEFNLERCWALGNVIENGLTYAVPIFIMITGATLIDYRDRYSTKEFFKKRIIKTVIPYLIWSVIAIILEIKGMFLVYYFFLNLFCVYLYIPILSSIKKEYKDKVILYLILISCVCEYLIPFTSRVFSVNFPLNIPLDLAGGYLIYALLGYIISKRDVPKYWRWISYLISIVGWIIYVGGTYVFSVQNGKIDYTFQGYTNLPCLLLSVGIFIFIKELGKKIQNEKVMKGIEWFSKYTFPIYLLHFFVIKLMIEPMFISFIHTVQYKFMAPIFTIIICVALTYVIRKIPIIQRVLP